MSALKEKLALPELLNKRNKQKIWRTVFWPAAAADKFDE